jgi:hypothetical protein
MPFCRANIQAKDKSCRSSSPFDTNFDTNAASWESAAIFYVPDVVYIHDREQALKGAKLYVGDGATVIRSMVRRRGDALFGHAPIRTQLTWCQKEGVPRAIFTHYGTELVAGDEPSLVARIEEMARERRVRAEVAYDGMEVVLR